MSIENSSFEHLCFEKGIKSDFVEWIFEILHDQSFFALIYWSFASWVNTKESDLDVVLSMPKMEEKLFYRIKDFLVELHKKYNLYLDNEVPYEKKLLIPYPIFSDAAALSGLPFEKDGIEVPKIIKTKEFLSSEQMRARLLFNILTVPTITFGTDMIKLGEFKKKAERFLILLWLHLTKKNCSKIDDFLQSLLYWTDWRDGEMFLGYKNNLKVVEYLKNVFTSSIEELTQLWVVDYISWEEFYVHQNKVFDILKKEKATFTF